MSQKIKHQISRDYRYQKSKGYKHSGEEGFNSDSGFLAFGKPIDWEKSKTRQRMGKENKNLF